MQLRRPVSAGQPLAAGDLQRPALVQRRGNVQIVLESAGLLLTAQGVAMETGGAGDQVRVLNPVSHAVMLAEVIGPGRVRVAPGSVPLPASAQTAFMYGR
jgi:flagella basal body P-ring formation protein FlgA